MFVGSCDAWRDAVTRSARHTRYLNAPHTPGCARSNTRDLVVKGSTAIGNVDGREGGCSSCHISSRRCPGLSVDCSVLHRGHCILPTAQRAWLFVSCYRTSLGTPVTPSRCYRIFILRPTDRSLAPAAERSRAIDSGRSDEDSQGGPTLTGLYW